MHHVSKFNQSQWLEPHIEFNTQKRIEEEKIGNALYKLMNIQKYNGKFEK